MGNIIRKHVVERGSKIVIHNGIVYLCGQVGAPETPLKEQAKEMLSRVDGFLQEAGTDKSNLLSATVYLSHMMFFDEFNRVWDAWITPGAGPVTRLSSFYF